MQTLGPGDSDWSMRGEVTDGFFALLDVVWYGQLDRANEPEILISLYHTVVDKRRFSGPVAGDEALVVLVSERRERYSSCPGPPPLRLAEMGAF